ncbi:MAG: hypothetical protein EOO36_07455 [Cytophagaceae bacterium]|nr:MAG: hypothetical protein EOO36_07455 [Cytophagaceae bacterium]
MKKLVPLFALALLSASACQRRGDEVQPRNYDALALETGYWEWESTDYRTGQRTPATEGYTRQLVFGSDGSVLIQHANKLNKKRAYTLSMGTLPACSTSQSLVPIITYETDSDLPNNDRKTYSIVKSPTGQSLTLVGEAACADGGAQETYRWVKE